MNAEAAKLGLHDTHFVRPDGLDAPGEYSSAADVTRLARLVMRTRFVRETVREQTATIAGGRTLHTWDDLLALFPQTIGVKTGHTDRRGLVPGRGRARSWGDDLRDAARLSDRGRSATSTSIAADLGPGAVPRSSPLWRRATSTRRVRLPYGRAPLALVAAKPLLTVARLGRPLTRDGRRAGGRLAAGAAGDGARTRRDPAGRAPGRPRDLVASRSINKPGLGSRLGWYAGRTLHHLANLL